MLINRMPHEERETSTEGQHGEKKQGEDSHLEVEERDLE